MMNKALFAALSFAVCLSANASLDSLGGAMRSGKLQAKEVELKAEGFELKSITDSEAGEAFRSKCGCAPFAVKFKKSSYQNGTTSSQERDFNLQISGIDGSETLVEITK